MLWICCVRPILQYAHCTLTALWLLLLLRRNLEGKSCIKGTNAWLAYYLMAYCPQHSFIEQQRLVCLLKSVRLSWDQLQSPQPATGPWDFPGLPCLFLILQFLHENPQLEAVKLVPSNCGWGQAPLLPNTNLPNFGPAMPLCLWCRQFQSMAAADNRTQVKAKCK